MTKGKNKEAQIAREEKRKQHIKLAIILPIIALAILSVQIFLGSRASSQADISVEFTTQILDSDNSTQGENALVAGKEALLTFRVKDKKTGKPISGLDPDISFYSSETGESQTEHKHFFGSYYTTGEISLAKIQVFVLNSERGTIEVLDTFGSYDPRSAAIKSLGTMTSKVIRLKGSPRQKIADMISSRYGDYVYATIPNESQVAVVNTISREAEKYIDVGAMPGMMFLQPKSGNLWVSNDDGESMSIIDTDSNVLVKTIETGKGYHQVAFSPENAYVTNSETDEVSVIRLDSLMKQMGIVIGRGSYGVGYSKVSNEIYVANIFQGTVIAIDARNNKIKSNIPLSTGVETVHISPDGRKAVVLNRHRNTAHVIDAMNGSVLTVTTGEAPGEVAFMEEYALVRNTYSPDVTYISMTDPGISNNEVVGSEPPLTWMPHSLVSTSYGDEVVITSPREGKILFMHTMNGEPMAMSSATVEYGSDAAAIVENRLHEIAPGTYQQYIILEREGAYDIEFKIQRMNASFKIEVLPDLAVGFQTIPLFNNTYRPGKSAILRYRIIERKTGKPEEKLKDLAFIIFKPAASKGTWTKRLSSRYLGNGTYETTITFPEEGEYMVTLTSGTLSSRGYETTYDYITVSNATTLGQK